MMQIKVFPGKLKGIIPVPGSKSLAHRAIICAALGAGASSLQGFSESEDLLATLEGVAALGALVQKQQESWQIIGMRRSDDRQKWAEKFASQTWRLNNQVGDAVINCRESGSTLRFILPLALVRQAQVHLVGQGKLGQRPLEPYFRVFQQQGLDYVQGPGPGLDLRVRGSLQPGEFVLPGDVSSQFISGLLLALPLLKEDSQIRLTTALESKDYIAMTIKVMQDFGVEVLAKNEQEYVIPGRQRYQSCNYAIEGDYSQAAFYLVAGALGSDVEVQGLKANSLQGDRAIIRILQEMGASFHQGDQGGLKAKGSPETIQGTMIDGSQCPDIIPVLAVAAALSQGTTQIINAGRLRLKESDRLKAIVTELKKLGAIIRELPDGLWIEGQPTLQGGVQVFGHGDHRIAMSLAIAATCCREPVVIDDAESVGKSYPDFWQDYQRLGGRYV